MTPAPASHPVVAHHAAQDHAAMATASEHLNGLVAVARMLARQPATPEARAYVSAILTAAEAALCAIDHPATLDLHPVDAAVATSPRDLLDQIEASWNETAARAGIALIASCQAPPDVAMMIDRPCVTEILDRLVAEALGAMTGGVLEVLIAAQADSAGALSVEARITAAGPSGADPFAASLMGCQPLVAGLGGALASLELFGDGAAVKLELTARIAPPPMALESEGGDNAGLDQIHVLIVDDNATNRMVAVALCQMFGCTAETANDGVEAVEMATKGRFDLILMDIKMPRMDGQEATRVIRASDGPAAVIPIIALTANGDAHAAASYIACGMNAVVEKPIKPERLLAALEDALAPPEPAAEAGPRLAVG